MDVKNNIPFSPGLGGRGSVVAIGGRGFCEGSGGLGPSPPSPVGHSNTIRIIPSCYIS